MGAVIRSIISLAPIIGQPPDGPTAKEVSAARCRAASKLAKRRNPCAKMTLFSSLSFWFSNEIPRVTESFSPPKSPVNSSSIWTGFMSRSTLGTWGFPALTRSPYSSCRRSSTMSRCNSPWPAIVIRPVSFSSSINRPASSRLNRLRALRSLGRSCWEVGSSAMDTRGSGFLKDS